MRRARIDGYHRVAAARGSVVSLMARWRRILDWRTGVAFGLPLGLYVLTLAPTIYNLDSAEFTTAAATGGIVRATGYPLYLLLGRVWSRLPIRDVGYRMNLFSAWHGALTVALAERVLRRLGVGPWAALGALGLLATAPFFWALSLIAEVYTLHTALMAAIILALLSWSEDPTPRRLAVTLGGAAVIGLVAAGVLGRQAASRFRPSATVAESRSLRERGELIDLAFSLIAERPLDGVGAGNFVLAARRAERPMEAQPVHNVPLLLAAEVSVLGAGLWYWLWLAPGLALRSRAEDGAPWSAVLTAAWFAWGIIALWDYYPWALNDGRLLGVTSLGLMAGTVKAGGESAALPERRGCTQAGPGATGCAG